MLTIRTPLSVLMPAVAAALILALSGCVKEEVRDMAKMGAVITAQSEVGTEFVAYFATAKQFTNVNRFDARDQFPSAAATTTPPPAPAPGAPVPVPLNEEQRQQLKSWIVDAHKVIANYYVALGALADEGQPLSVDELSSAKDALEKFPPTLNALGKITADEKSAILKIAGVVADLFTDAYKEQQIKALVIENHDSVVHYLQAMIKLTDWYELQLGLLKDNVRTYHRELYERSFDLDHFKLPADASPEAQAAWNQHGQALLGEITKGLTALRHVTVLSWRDVDAGVQKSIDRVIALRAGYQKILEAEGELMKVAKAGLPDWSKDAYQALKAKNKELKAAYDAIRKAW